jgi:hypothetical protein
MHDTRRWGRFEMASLAMSLVFLMFTLVQYNDPDPARWMAMYGAAALVSAAAALRAEGAGAPAAVVALAALGWGLSVLLGVAGHPVAWGQVFATTRMIDSDVEEAREALGLLIVVLWAGWIAVRGWRRRRAD